MLRSTAPISKAYLKNCLCISPSAHTVLVLFWLNCFVLTWLMFLSFPKSAFKVDHGLSAKSHWGHSGGLDAIRCPPSQTTKPGPVLRLYSVQVAHRHTSRREMWPLACVQGRDDSVARRGARDAASRERRGSLFSWIPSPQRTWGILSSFRQNS